MIKVFKAKRYMARIKLIKYDGYAELYPSKRIIYFPMNPELKHRENGMYKGYYEPISQRYVWLKKCKK